MPNCWPRSMRSRTRALATPGDGGAPTPLTYFEFGTLAALWLFARAELDALVLEVGLGGRLDAVNVVDADVAVLTSVAIDHIDYLGSTREDIGREKAGIFRAGRAGGMRRSRIRRQAWSRAREEIGASLLRIGRDYGFVNEGTQWKYWGPGGRALRVAVSRAARRLPAEQCRDGARRARSAARSCCRCAAARCAKAC